MVVCSSKLEGLGRQQTRNKNKQQVSSNEYTLEYHIALQCLPFRGGWVLGIKGKYLPRQAIGRNLPSCPGNTLTNRKKAVRVVALQKGQRFRSGNN